jgi:hypothetical protein
MRGALRSMGVFDDGGIDEDEAEFGGIAEDLEVNSAEEHVAGALEFVGDGDARGEYGLIHGGIEFDEGVRKCVEDGEADRVLAEKMGTPVFEGEAVPGGVAPVDAQVSVEEVDDGGVVLQSGPGKGGRI